MGSTKFLLNSINAMQCKYLKEETNDETKKTIASTRFANSFYSESDVCKSYLQKFHVETYFCTYLIHCRHSLLILGWIYAQMQEVAESREKRLFTADWVRAQPEIIQKYEQLLENNLEIRKYFFEKKRKYSFRLCGFLVLSKYFIDIFSFERKKVKFGKLIRANLAGGPTLHANHPVMSNLNRVFKFPSRFTAVRGHIIDLGNGLITNQPPVFIYLSIYLFYHQYL